MPRIVVDMVRAIELEQVYEVRCTWRTRRCNMCLAAFSLFQKPSFMCSLSLGVGFDGKGVLQTPCDMLRGEKGKRIVFKSQKGGKIRIQGQSLFDVLKVGTLVEGIFSASLFGCNNTSNEGFGIKGRG